MKPSRFLAFDLGASSGRAVAGCWDGRFSLEEVHRFPNGGVRLPEGLQWDVLRLWSETRTGLENFRARYGCAPDGVSVDGWGVDFALLDARGRLLGNPWHYRDARTQGATERVFLQMPAEELYARTGVQPMAINTLFQLHVMAEAGDPQLSAAQTLLLLPDYFHFLLSGIRRAEFTEASTTQLLHAGKRNWDGEVLARLGLPAGILPPIVAPATVLGPAREALTRELGFKMDFPVIATASHDTACAVAAIPLLDAASAFLSCGTWSLIGIESNEPVATTEALRGNFTNEGGAGGKTLLMKNLTGLWLLQECQRLWAKTGKSYEWRQIVEMAAAAEPFRSLVDTEDAAFLAPDNMLEAIASFCRNTGQPEPRSAGDVARCCLESLALQYRKALDELERLTGRRLKTLRIAGGGSQNSLLCQWTADACERPVLAGPAEASALGNVMLQAVATGLIGGIQQGRQLIAESFSGDQYQPQDSLDWEAAARRLAELRGTV
jgi:rhamnulokinase